jgi:DNA polymerase-3 subunit chi
MARIDFHSNVSDKLEYACHIVMVGERVDLKKLDELLWKFSATDFLPHCFIEDEAAIDTPILLTEHFLAPALSHLPHADVLIHLGMRMPQDVPALLARFPRIVEVVTIDEAERLAGRERYKAYRDLGHELHNFDQSKA